MRQHATKKLVTSLESTFSIFVVNKKEKYMPNKCTSGKSINISGNQLKCLSVHLCGLILFHRENNLGQFGSQEEKVNNTSTDRNRIHDQRCKDCRSFLCSPPSCIHVKFQGSLLLGLGMMQKQKRQCHCLPHYSLICVVISSWVSCDPKNKSSLGWNRM